MTHPFRAVTLECVWGQWWVHFGSRPRLGPFASLWEAAQIAGTLEQPLPYTRSRTEESR